MPFLRISSEIHSALQLLSLLRSEPQSVIASAIIQRDLGSIVPLNLGPKVRLRIDEQARDHLKEEAESRDLRMRPLAEAKLAKGTMILLMEQVGKVEELEEWKSALSDKLGIELEPLAEESWRLRLLLANLKLV